MIDREYVQYRTNLAAQWERPIVTGLRQIEQTLGLPRSSITCQKNEWFAESWWIERYGVDPDALPLQVPICIIIGIELHVEYSTQQHSFRVLTRMGCDESSMRMIVERFDNLPEVLSFILSNVNQFQW